MKIYVAGRFHKKDIVKEVYKVLRDHGNEVIFDWTEHKYIRPYECNMQEAREQAIACIKGVNECDVFIMLSDENGRGMYIEFGVAIALNNLYGKPKMFIIGEHNINSLFYFYPNVVRKDTLEEVLAEL